MFFRDGKEAGVMSLPNLFGEYCSLPKADRAAWMSRTISALVNQMEIPDDFEDVKPDLFPTIRPKSMLEVMKLDVELQGGKWKGFAAWPLSEHLTVCLVYDLPNSMRFVTQDDLATWGVTLYEAGEAAKHNLEEKPFSMSVIAEKLYVLINGDAYDASRMLLLDAIGSLDLTGDPVAIPMTRDVLLLAGSDDSEGLGLMLDLADEYKENPRPICPVAHRLVGGEWQVWTPPSDNSHFNRFHRNQLEHAASEYAEQKRLMEKQNEQTGTDVFVASFSAIAKGDKVLSYSVWSETVPTWLPKTDYVAFMSADEQPLGLVPWDRVERIMGEAMRPMDCYPPRWLVESFPDDEQLGELKPGDFPG